MHMGRSPSRLHTVGARGDASDAQASETSHNSKNRQEWFIHAAKNPENIMRQREAGNKARGRMCAESERGEECGEAEAGRDSRFGFCKERDGKMKQHKLLINQGEKI
jgi:hypothetical protein